MDDSYANGGMKRMGAPMEDNPAEGDAMSKMQACMAKMQEAMSMMQEAMDAMGGAEKAEPPEAQSALAKGFARGRPMGM